MIEFAKEIDMRLPVAEWILARGQIPLLECWSMRQADFCAVRFNGNRLIEIDIIELKLTAIAAVLRQLAAHARGYCTGQIWAALPLSVARKYSERFDGFGLLGVAPDGCQVIREAPARIPGNLTRWEPSFFRRRTEYIWRMRNPQMKRYSPLPEGMETCSS